MPYMLFHPEIGDDPGSAAMMWLLFGGIVVVAIAALYFGFKLLRFLFKRGTKG